MTDYLLDFNLEAEKPSGITTAVLNCSTHFPWYRQYITDTTSLVGLPVIDQSILTRNYYTAMQVPADADAYLTSGTSGGIRKQILYSPEDDQDYIEQRRALFSQFLRGVPTGAVAVADLGTGHAAASASKIFSGMGFLAKDIDFTKPITEHIRLLNEWQPKVLFTMPMILDQLMQSRNALEINPEKIIVVGDLAPAAWRKAVAEYFDIEFTDVLDVYGSIEIGAIAYSDAASGRYVFHSHIIPEVIPAEDLAAGRIDAAAMEGSGTLLLTSSTRRYFPAIRYVTGDVITGLRKEGVDGPWTFERIEGRQQGDFKHGERISSHDLCSAMATVFPGRPFEVVDGNSMKIRVVGDAIDENQTKRFRELINAASPDVAVMTHSGLIADISLESISNVDQLVSGAKRRFNVRAM